MKQRNANITSFSTYAQFLIYFSFLQYPHLPSVFDLRRNMVEEQQRFLDDIALNEVS